MDKEKIKDVLDKFENDDYVEAREILQQEINKEKDNYLKDRLSLKDDE
jgi:uncharacterized protein YqgQ